MTTDGDAARSTKVTVVIATVGRAEVLCAVAPFLRGQTRLADRVIYSAHEPRDVEGVRASMPEAEVLFGPKGLAVQRNRALQAIGDDAGLVVFFDDDLIPSRLFLERAVAFFAANPDVVGASGDLVADGVNHGGFEVAEAAEMLAPWDASPKPLDAPHWRINHMYGCNMVVRAAPARAVLFDERLPLYAWQEDRDFSVRLRAHGAVVRTPALSGVHLGVRGARTPGRRLGYAQVINPLYLLRKGTMRPAETFALIGRNMASNAVRSLAPEPWVDRVGRLQGNLRALADAARGVLEPERMLNQ